MNQPTVRWSWRKASLFGIVVAVVALIAYPWINSYGSINKGVTEKVEDISGSKELVVFVHGYDGNGDDLTGVREAIRKVRPDADIVQFDYPAQVFSNANVFSLASQMNELIYQRDKSKNYDRITLCGYSMGALLIRKAYVYGCGSVADAPGVGSSHAIDGEAQPWTKKVDRFVLLAGMNRGWSRYSIGSDASLTKKCMQRLGLSLAWLTRTGLLIRSCEKGEPFVANLRLQWLEVTRRSGQSKKPIVIQLLGDRDDVVSADDSKDVTVARDFIWTVVNNTGHGNMPDVGETGSALERKRKIQMAFGDKDTVDQLRRLSPKPKLIEDPEVKSVVFVLHGIRDLGDWTSQFEKPLQDAYYAAHPDGAKLVVYRANYSYFGMGPFLLWSDRQEKVRWFMDQVTEIVAQYPNLKPEEIHFIGHSNGTYILASALARYASLRIGRAVLAGSVIRSDFKWQEYTGRFASVRNYVGYDDWVVALLPRVFEMPVFNLFNSDIGSAGFNGFQDHAVKSIETKYVKGAHSAALRKENIAPIVAFIVNGELVEDKNILEGSHEKNLEKWSRMCWLLWILFACVLAVGFWLAPILLTAVIRLFSSNSFNATFVAWAGRLAYVFFVWLFLSTY